MKTKFGLSVALALPVDASGAVDFKRMVDHATWCLANGCESATVFGTTGEGASLGAGARDRMLGALAGAGIDMSRQVIGGVAASSLHDALDQSRQILGAGCRGILLAPPFYFKGVSDEGLFAWFAQLFDKLGAAARDVIVYNIPSVTAVKLSVALIERLRRAYPEVFVGVKDSSGDFDYTRELLAAHRDLSILIGDERTLAAGVRLGAEGSISGLANLRPADLVRMIHGGEDIAVIPEIVEEVLRHPVVPAVKTLIAHQTGDTAWLHTRAPLVPLDAESAAQLTAAYDRLTAQGSVAA